jgi:hypothetical protein
VGVESAIYAQNNVFRVKKHAGITPDRFISVLKGTAIFEEGTLLNPPSKPKRHKGEVDVVAAYNELYDPDLVEDVGWTPTLFVDLMDTWHVMPVVESGAGPFNWEHGHGHH